MLYIKFCWKVVGNFFSVIAKKEGIGLLFIYVHSVCTVINLTVRLCMGPFVSW